MQDLSAAVDVYSDWIDACDTVAKDATSLNHGDVPYSERGPRGSSHFEADADTRIVQDEYEDDEADYEN